jgi:hypothetical protein
MLYVKEQNEKKRRREWALSRNIRLSSSSHDASYFIV